MPFLSISSRKTFTTTLSVEQAIEAVQEMLSSRQQIFSFKLKQYSGKINGSEFSVAAKTLPDFGFLKPGIEGSIKAQERTVVELKRHLPIIPMSPFIIVLFVAVPSILLDEQMTINGVLREPTAWERYGFAFLMPATVVALFLGIYLPPIRSLQNELRKRLRLEEIAKRS